MADYEMLQDDVRYRDGAHRYARKKGEVWPISDPDVVRTLLETAQIAPAAKSPPKAESEAGPIGAEVEASDRPSPSIKITGESTRPGPKSKSKPRGRGKR